MEIADVIPAASPGRRSLKTWQWAVVIVGAVVLAIAALVVIGQRAAEVVISSEPDDKQLVSRFLEIRDGVKPEILSWDSASVDTRLQGTRIKGKMVRVVFKTVGIVRIPPPPKKKPRTEKRGDDVIAEIVPEPMETWGKGPIEKTEFFFIENGKVAITGPGPLGVGDGPDWKAKLEKSIRDAEWMERNMGR